MGVVDFLQVKVQLALAHESPVTVVALERQLLQVNGGHMAPQLHQVLRDKGTGATGKLVAHCIWTKEAALSVGLGVRCLATDARLMDQQVALRCVRTTA